MIRYRISIFLSQTLQCCGTATKSPLKVRVRAVFSRMHGAVGRWSPIVARASSSCRRGLFSHDFVMHAVLVVPLLAARPAEVWRRRAMGRRFRRRKRFRRTSLLTRRESSPPRILVAEAFPGFLRRCFFCPCIPPSDKAFSETTLLVPSAGRFGGCSSVAGHCRPPRRAALSLAYGTRPWIVRALRLLHSRGGILLRFARGKRPFSRAQAPISSIASASRCPFSAQELLPGPSLRQARPLGSAPPPECPRPSARPSPEVFPCSRGECGGRETVRDFPVRARHAPSFAEGFL